MREPNVDVAGMRTVVGEGKAKTMRTKVKASLVGSPCVITFAAAVGATLSLGCGARTGLPSCDETPGESCPTEPGTGTDAGPSQVDAGTDAGSTLVIPNNIATGTKCTCSCTFGLNLGNNTQFGPTDIPVCLPPALNYKLGGPNISVADFTAGEMAYCQSTVQENLETILGGATGTCVPQAGVAPACTCTLASTQDLGPERDEPACDKPCVSTACTFLGPGANCDAVLESNGTIDVSQCSCNEAVGFATAPPGVPNSCPGPTTVCRPKPGLIDPPSVTTGLLTEFLGAMSSINVDPMRSSATATASFTDDLGLPHSDTETSNLTGSASLFGEARADGTADLILEFDMTGTDVTFHFSGVDIFDNPSVPVTGISFTGGTGVTTFHVDAAGNGVIPMNTLAIRSAAVVDGTQLLDDQLNAEMLNVTVDFVHKTFAIAPFMATISGQSATVTIAGAITNQPPTSIAGASQTVECTSPSGAPATLDGSGSFDPDGNLVAAAWYTGADFNPANAIAHSLTTSVVAPFSPPSTTSVYTLLVTDTGFQMNTSQTSITVRDTTPPTFAPLVASLVQTSCNPATEATVLAIPTATDACSATVAVTGAVISENGVAISPSLPVVNGTVSLAPGVFVIEWTAIDASGNVATTTQTLTVRLGVEANGTLTIDDRAVVQLPNGTPAAVGNTRTGPVTIGVVGKTGNVLTDGSVLLRSRAIVQGSIVAEGTFTPQPPVTVTGTITTGVQIALPPGKNLSGIVFPSPLGAARDLEPGVVETLPPGSYASIAVKSRAVLTLSSGTYFVGNLDLEPQATVNLNQAAGPVQLYVQSSIIDRGEIQSISGAAAGFVLGYAGTSDFDVQSPFLAGTLIAPNADVVISSLGSHAFTGELFAKSIEVQPDATLTCK